MSNKRNWVRIPVGVVLIVVLILSSLLFNDDVTCYAKAKKTHKKAVKVVTYKNFSDAVTNLRQAAVNTQTVNFRFKMKKTSSVNSIAERLWNKMSYDNGTSKRRGLL
jgi:hypothetical protein